jgi:tetratricopeptide (TPR) repeat protein
MQHTSNFNLAEIVPVLLKNKKLIIGFVVISLVITSITLFIVPKYYRSTSVVVAANPALADKARLFNKNIEGLYSNYGSSDDLDRIYGIANLDTTFKTIIREFNLIQYYKLKEDSADLNERKALLYLRDDLILQKTELNQLKIMVLTKDKILSAKIVNRVVSFVHEILQNVWRKSYQSSLKHLQYSITLFEKEYKNLSDSIVNNSTNSTIVQLLSNKKNVLLDQINEYQKAANEFALAIQNNPPALIEIEKGYPSAKADKPKKLEVLTAAFFISFIFACLLVLFYKRKN